MVAAVTHAAHPLETQCKDEAALAIPQTAALLPKISRTLEAQKMRWDARLDALGGHEISGLKNAVSAVLGGGASAINNIRSKDRVSKMLRDDQAALSLLTISYELLHATALGLGDATTAQLAETSLSELTPLVMDISNCVPDVVIAELKLDNLPVNIAAIEATRDATRKAWSRPAHAN
jgi:hypothetical protein